MQTHVVSRPLLTALWLLVLLAGQPGVADVSITPRALRVAGTRTY